MDHLNSQLSSIEQLKILFQQDLGNIIKCSLDPWSWKPKTERKLETFNYVYRWSSSPEKDAQNIGYEQHKAHAGGETLTGATPLNLLVLGNVRQGPAKHHEAGRQPGQGRPHVILPLYVHLVS